jgi:hypothetical protein
MNINIKLLDKCPELSEYEKDLIRRVDVNHETQASVAKSLKKTPGTISTQHKTASKKFEKWLETTGKQNVGLSKDDFERVVFQRFREGKLPDAVIAEFGRADEVMSLWGKYRTLKEDDYCRAQSKIAEYGFEVKGDSNCPLCEQLDSLFEYIDYLNEEDEKVREVLEAEGVKGGKAFGGYGSISEGVQRLAEKLHRVQSALALVNKQKEDMSS